MLNLGPMISKNSGKHGKMCGRIRVLDNTTWVKGVKNTAFIKGKSHLIDIVQFLFYILTAKFQTHVETFRDLKPSDVLGLTKYAFTVDLDSPNKLRQL